MPGSRCSKSVSLSTFSTPPRLPPVSGSFKGLWNPPVLKGLLLATLLELLEPHAATARANDAARAVAATALINLIGRLLCRCGSPSSGTSSPSSGTPRIQGVLQPVAEQVER